jgi:hypothetical protein
MRKIISVPIFLLGAFLLAPLAHGTTPIAASGTITPIQSLGDVIMVADGNTFFHHNDVHTLTGTLVGTTSEDVTIVVNLSTGQGTLSGLLFFTGTANGVSGTAVLRLVGVVSVPTIQGSFAIISGDGGLANLHGQGTFVFPNAFIGGTYSGQVHFD